jgi:peptide/nickel transport system permease protein
MSLIGWAGLARIIRGFVLSLREKEYILHARTLGAPAWYIIIRHALPNTLSYALVSAFLTIPTYILGEAALSMLGLGITEPYPSWGNMLQAAFFITDLTNYPWILAPGVVIFITICLYNIIGDNLRRAFDPYYG